MHLEIAVFSRVAVVYTSIFSNIRRETGKLLLFQPATRCFRSLHLTVNMTYRGSGHRASSKSPVGVENRSKGAKLAVNTK